MCGKFIFWRLLEKFYFYLAASFLSLVMALQESVNDAENGIGDQSAKKDSSKIVVMVSEFGGLLNFAFRKMKTLPTKKIS